MGCLDPGPAYYTPVGAAVTALVVTGRRQCNVEGEQPPVVVSVRARARVDADEAGPLVAG